MPKGNHGDRLIDPEPLEELVARHELEIEGGPQQDPSAIGPIMNEEEWQQRATPIEYREPTQPYASEVDIEAGVRMQSAAIAGGSFGAAGCFDDDLLLRRANAIFTYIKSGLS